MTVSSMPSIELYLTKTIEQNAALCYEKAKRAKQKKEGLLKARDETKRKLATLLKEKERAIEQLRKKTSETAPKREKQWYEKFHWFQSSEGFLCIGGRDATTNDILIKKHLEPTDLVLHTDIAGSPFFVIKNGQQATMQTINEAAQATAAHSRAWKSGLTTLEVFYVKPEQVSRKAKAGEYLGKGAFMIYGETKYLHPLIEIAVGIKEGQILGGPVDAIKACAENYVILVPGRDKTSDIAKKIRKTLGSGELDEIVRNIPAGGSALRRK